MPDDEKSDRVVLDGMMKTVKRLEDDPGPVATVVLLLVFSIFVDLLINDAQFIIEFLNWVGTVF